MTMSSARAVPWHAVARFHREAARRAGEAFFALPVTISGTKRWSSLNEFQPQQLSGPWELDFGALQSLFLQRDIRNGLSEAFIGGPCWPRRVSGDGKNRRLAWIPLIYREVKVEFRDDRVRIEPAHDGWEVCPLVLRLLELQGVQTVEPLDDMLPDLLPVAEAKAANDGKGLARALVDAFQLAVPELGDLFVHGRDDFPVDQLEFVPSPWVLFTASAEEPATIANILRDYGQLKRRLAAAPQDIGGLGLLENAPGPTVREAPVFAPIVPLNASQRSAVEAALAGRPTTVISAPPECGKSQVLLSILLNAWANGTSVLYASNNKPAVDLVRQHLNNLERDFEIAVPAGARQAENIDEVLGRTLDVVKARQGESHYGGSPSTRKHTQLIDKKRQLRGLLDSQIPQRVSQAIEAAVEAHAAQRKALSNLASQREELVAKLRDLGVEDEPTSFDERVLDPLRKWRSAIDATRRLVEEDAQRHAALQRELAAARGERDSVLADYDIETRPDQESPWLLAEPGFDSFEQAMAALSEKLREPFENESADDSWNKAYDAWPSSEAATDWERKAREMASMIRPAGIALKEKTEEVRAAREALEAAQRDVQEATKSSSLDIRRKYLDEWAACYAELCAAPQSKLAFLPQSRNAELLRQLEEMERRFRSAFPAHLWTSIGTLDESGRARLSVVVERAREWIRARDDWERLSSTRDEIEAQTDALRRRLVELGERSLSSEVTPTACGTIASQLNEKASVAASAAAAWSKRENRERLPAELVELAKQIRAAGAGVPIKERWTKGAGAPLIAALDSLAGNPGAETIAPLRREVLGSATADPILQIWRRAYEAEKQAAAVAEEMERIPSRAARLTHWKSGRPASMPAKLEVAGAFDGDDAHPVWAFLKECEAWSERWTTYRGKDASALEQTANAEGARAIQCIRKAVEALPKCEQRTWFEMFVKSAKVSEPWPVDDITERAAYWRPERLEAEIEKVDAQLERATFETAKEQWLERVAHDTELLRSLGALRDHFGRNGQRIQEDGYADFERALKAQPVWITNTMSTPSIPMQPGLFDLVVIDDATRCTLTDVIPLIFRAKRLVAIVDPERSPTPDRLGVETERTIAARFGIEEWTELLGHVGNDAYKATVSALPGREADVISLGEDK